MTTKKKRLLNYFVFSIASYVYECLGLTEAGEWRTACFELCCYRRLLQISWTKKRTNECIRNALPRPLLRYGMLFLLLNPFCKILLMLDYSCMQMTLV